MTREITIQQIRIRVPRGADVRSVRDGETIAKAVAREVAHSLTEAGALRSGEIDRMRLTVAQKRGSALETASAVGKAIGGRISSPGRQR